MILSKSEISHIYANRNRKNPAKTLKVLAEINNCTEVEMKKYLAENCESYRRDHNIVIQQAIVVDCPPKFKVLHNGQITVPWKKYIRDCITVNLAQDKLLSALTSVLLPESEIECVLAYYSKKKCEV